MPLFIIDTHLLHQQFLMTANNFLLLGCYITCDEREVEMLWAM